MRIGIDARFLTHPQPGGFKTYITNLVVALADMDDENQYTLYTDRSAVFDATALGPNFTTKVVPGTLPIIGMPWREQIGLAYQANRDKLDLLHSPSLTAPLCLFCPSVVTIHDMIWYMHGNRNKGGHTQARRWGMELYYRLITEISAKRAAAMITVSDHAKQTIVLHLKVPPERVFVTHEAASPIFRRVDDENALYLVRRQHEIHSDYILAIGSADPRKNMSTLLEAYALLPDSVQACYQLVIVLTHVNLASELTRRVKELGLASFVRFVSRVTDEELVLLYSDAKLFVFPSLYEGFGLPPLEAMACGTPVVASDRSSIPEIVGDAALTVAPENAPQMAATMVRALKDDDLRAMLVRRGYERAMRFSWRRCAKETIEVYKRVRGE